MSSFLRLFLLVSLAGCAEGTNLTGATERLCSDGGVCDEEVGSTSAAATTEWTSVGAVSPGGLSRYVSSPRDGFRSVEVRSIHTVDGAGRVENIARTEDINGCVHGGQVRGNFRWTPCGFKIRNTDRGTRRRAGRTAVLQYRFHTN